MSIFSQSVYCQLKKIPAGSVTTYKALASASNYPNAARAVGNILNKNKKLIVVPCHRVINSSGKIGGYQTGKVNKKILLKQEGLEIRGEKVVNFKKFLFNFNL